MGKAPCCDKTNVKKGPWSPEEDAELKSYIEEHGTGGNWIALPHKIGLKRCGKSCRLRWLNYLRPNIKHGGFSDEEDQIICSLYISIGSRWSIIAAQLPGRTDNEIKNYWNTRLKKKLFGRQRETSQSRRLTINQETEEINGMNISMPSQDLSVSALERMQLHMQLQGLQSSNSSYNNPALWPEFHTLSDMIFFQNQQRTDPITTTITQQACNVSAAEPSHHKTMFPINTDMPGSMNESIQQGFGNSSLYFVSPSTSGTSAQTSETSNSNFSSIQDMLYSENQCFVGQEDLDCFKEMNIGEKNVWTSNGFDEKLSSTSWDPGCTILPDSMLDESKMGYNL